MMKTGLRALVLNLHYISRVISLPSTLSCLAEFSRGLHGYRLQQEQNKLQVTTQIIHDIEREKILGGRRQEDAKIHGFSVM